VCFRVNSNLVLRIYKPITEHFLLLPIIIRIIIKIIIIIIIFIIIISFMQGIYTYIPETNYVPREYSVAAILLLLFMVLISLVSVLNLLYFIIIIIIYVIGCQAGYSVYSSIKI